MGGAVGPSKGADGVNGGSVFANDVAGICICHLDDNGTAV